MDTGYVLRVYTREPEPGICPDGLARSIHLAVTGEDGREILLNHNDGVLFAEALIDTQNRICPRSLRDPGIRENGKNSWILTAERCLEDGTPEEPAGPVLTWETEDFCRFRYLGLRAETAGDRRTETTVPEKVFRKILARWEDPCGYPFRISRKNEPGIPYPATEGFGDPVILDRDGKYYFLGTTDFRNDIGLYVREADSLQGLFAEGYEEHLILGEDAEHGFLQTFWAPEFHTVNGELYIFFAVSGKKWGPRCHLMKLKPGGDIIRAEDWTLPVPVTRADGSPLTDEDGITLDMTCFRTDRTYAVWSYRKYIGTEKDTGSMLYIAALNEEDPTRLDSDPVLLSRPLYGWENVEHTINNEGPYPFLANGKVYLTYSGGSANSYTYAIGLLTADSSADLLRPDAWTKSNVPVLNQSMIRGEYGPGHNSFFTDRNGDVWIAYHTETSREYHVRCPVIRRLSSLPDD